MRVVCCLDFGLERWDCGVDGRKKKSWHQRVALLAALGLTDIVGAAIIVEPSVTARRGIELPRVGEQRLQLGLGKQCT